MLLLDLMKLYLDFSEKLVPIVLHSYRIKYHSTSFPAQYIKMAEVLQYIIHYAIKVKDV